MIKQQEHHRPLDLISNGLGLRTHSERQIRNTQDQGVV